MGNTPKPTTVVNTPTTNTPTTAVVATWPERFTASPRYRFTGPNGHTVTGAAIIGAYAIGVRAVADIPCPDMAAFDRIAATFRSAVVGAYGEPTCTRPMHEIWCGMKTSESQNALYVAAFVGGRKPIADETWSAMWSVILPNNKCKFRDHTDYGKSAIGHFLDSGHVAGCPMIDGDWRGIIDAWRTWYNAPRSADFTPSAVPVR